MKNMILAIAYGLFLLLMAGMIVVNVRLTLLPVIIAIILAIWMKPIVGLYLCVISDLWLSGMQFYGANPRTYIIIIIISSIFASSILRGEWKKEGNINFYVLLPPILLLFWGLFINIVLKQTPSSTYIRWAITFFVTINIAILISYLINNTAKLKHFFYWTAFVLSISALIGILQFFIGESFCLLRSSLGKQEIAFAWEIVRPAGLSFTKILFSYELLSIFLLAVTVLALYGNASKAEKIFLSIISTIIGIAILVNFTRSAIGGIIIGGIGILLLTKEGKWKIIASCLMGIGLVLFVISVSSVHVKPYHRRIMLQDTSAFGRIPRLLLGCNIVIKNPLGLGGSSVLRGEIKKNLYVTGNMPGISIDSASAHNHFLNVAVYFGFPGVLLYIWFLWRLVRMERYLLESSKEQFLKVLSTGSVGFLIAYLFNSFFHNYGPMGGDNFFWYILGIILAAYNIVSRESEKEMVV